MNLLPRSAFFRDLDFFDTEDRAMKADIYEKDGAYHIDMELPGFEKDKIQVDYDNGYLTITATREDHIEEDGTYLKRERYYGEYKRSFSISNIDENGIKGNYQDGILKLILPKKSIPDTKKQILID